MAFFVSNLVSLEQDAIPTNFHCKSLYLTTWLHRVMTSSFNAMKGFSPSSRPLLAVY